MDVESIIGNFCVSGKVLNYAQIKGGNVNSTYLITLKNDNKIAKYVLQKINKFVFSDPKNLMDNVVRVIERLKERDDESNRKTITYIKSINDLYYYVDENGDYLRLYEYIDDSLCFEKTENLSIIYEAGNGFGQFLNDLTGFDSSTLYRTIPDFHNTKKRFSALFNSAKINVANNRRFCNDELNYLASQIVYADFYGSLIKKRKILPRVTHNDTKISNVLFDKNTLKAISVIDLDTVMEGIIAYDFGDGARSVCSTCSENETDTDKIDFSISKYQAFSQGFIGKVRGVLSDAEKETLFLSPFIVSLELATRFLKDFLDGNVYFKCDYEKQNLLRARNQIVLAKRIFDRFEQLQSITQKCF